MALFLAAVPPLHAQPRVMPLGDDLTAGVNGGYRPEVWRLVEAGGSHIDFVGSQYTGQSYVPDPQNEGRAGWSTQRYLELVRDRYYNLLGTYRPDVVLLMLGTTDLMQNLTGGPGRLATILDEIARQSPAATTIVASLTPMRNREAQVLAYNAELSNLVGQRQALGQRLFYVDMYPAVSLADLPDGVHPNDAGYRKLGAAWYAALAPLLGGSVVPPPPTNRPPSVTITSPTTGTSFTAPAAVTLTASATDADGMVQRVEWYLGSALLEAQFGAGPVYSLSWTSSTPGPYTFTAKAIDGGGAVATSNAVTISVALASQTVFRILPLGDSITYGTMPGGGSNGGYRPELWRLATTSGFPIDFVGFQGGGFLTDPQNEGRAGATTDGILAVIRDRYYNLLGFWRPDVVLLMVGTNDILRSLPDAASRLALIIDEIVRQRPAATTIVAGLYPLPGREAQVLAYNQAILSQVLQRQALGQRVRYVDMYPVVGVTELGDTVHPNEAAYRKLGAAWFQTLLPVMSGQ